MASELTVDIKRECAKKMLQVTAIDMWGTDPGPPTDEMLDSDPTERDFTFHLVDAVWTVLRSRELLK